VKHSVTFAAICRAALMVLGMLLSFLSLKLYSAYLTRDIYGTILVASQFLLYLPLLGGGFGMILYQQMLSAKKQEKSREVAVYCQVLNSYVLALVLVVAIILMSIYSQTSMARQSGLPIGLFIGIAIAFIITFHAGGQFGLLTGLGRQTYNLILTGLGNIATFIVLYVSFRAGMAVGVALFLPVARILQLRLFPGLPYITFKRPPDFWKRLRDIFPSAANWLQSQLIIMLLFTVDLMLMGFIYGATAAAVYGIIARIMTLSRQALNSLSESMWPQLAASDEQRKIELMRRVDRLNAWVTGGWFGAIAATVQPFLIWFMKADWVAGSAIVYLAVGRSAIAAMSAPHGYGLLGAGRFGELARVMRNELIAMCVFVVILTRFLGPESIPLATLLGTVAGSLWYMTYLYFKPVGQTAWFREWIAIYLRGIISAAIAFSTAAAAWHFAGTTLHLQGWAAMFAGGCGLIAAVIAGTATAFLRGGATIQPLGPWLKIPARW
jgi:O-antigen/teichoic acid export membrane protein